MATASTVASSTSRPPPSWARSVASPATGSAAPTLRVAAGAATASARASRRAGGRCARRATIPATAPASTSSAAWRRSGTGSPVASEADLLLAAALERLEARGAAGTRSEALAALSLALRRLLDREWAALPAGARLRALSQDREHFARLVAGVERLAGTELPAVIEDGTPERSAAVALAVHQASPRRDGPCLRAPAGDRPPWEELWRAAADGSLLVQDLGLLSAEEYELLDRLRAAEGSGPRLLATSRWELGAALPAARAAGWPLRLRAGPTASLPSGPGAGAFAGTLADIEARAIAARLRVHQGQRQRTADSLGIDRKTLYRKLRRYGLA
ncbi:MAG: hypothetical protein D6731_16890 [Planctomycetota bacterium]|nr:MAG: hypothetical protein D6731_16890 [Planctomycetota bacterium]